MMELSSQVGNIVSLRYIDSTSPTKHPSFQHSTLFPRVVMGLNGRCAHCQHPASLDRIVLHSGSSTQDQDSECELWFLLHTYFFCTINPYLKFYHCKLEITFLWVIIIFMCYSKVRGIMYVMLGVFCFK